jgi:adenylate cyclase
VAEEHARRKLAAILSADVKGYSRLMEDDEEATVRTITSYRELIILQIQRQNGRVVDAKGDNLLAEFPSVVDAVRCAVQVQNELKEKNARLPEHRKMEFRIGVNLGDVIEEGDTLYGDGVNIAARLESLAEGGGICVSGTAFDHIGKRLIVGYEYLGEQQVKNIEKPVRVYKVLMEPEVAGKVIGERTNKAKPWRWPAFVFSIAILLLIAALLMRQFYLSPPLEPASEEKMAFPLPERPSIAVLSFDNMSGDPQQEYFGDGLAEEIITALSKVPRLFVIARDSTFTYKGKSVKVNQIAEELGVRYVLEGSVRKSENRVRITAQLIDTIEGHHLWADRYDRDLKDIFTLQDEITKKIVTELQVQLTTGEEARLWARGTDNLEAYLKYLQGLDHKTGFNKEENTLTRRLAEEAIALDPQYSNAYALLGLTHMMEVWLKTTDSPMESIQEAMKLAKKAIELDSTNAVAHGSLGFLLTMAGQHEKGIAEGEKAVALDPNSAMAHQFLGLSLRFGGRPKDAIPVIEKAIRLDPFAPSNYIFNLGLAHLFAGQHDKAIQECKKATDREPNNLGAHIALVAAYSISGRHKDARAAASEILRIEPKFSVEYFSRTLTYKNQSDKDRFISALRQAGLPEHPPLPLPDKPSIAVLPFENMSGDPEQEYFSDGITEEIITALSKTPKLFVIARTSSFQYKGRDVDVRAVGRELGVRYVLEGSVRKAGDKVRVTAQLIDTTTDGHVWAERYDRELIDIFAIQDEITLEIIKAMQVNLTMGETARVTGRGTKNLDAYLKALQAQEQWLRMDKEGSIKARQLAAEAIALDPEYGYPYAIVAWCNMLDVIRHYTQSPEESLSLAVKAVQKALALDKSDHRIHRVLSNLYVMQGKHEEAIASSKKALELCPGGAGAYENLGIALLFACRPSEAIPMLEKAIELDPFPPAVCHRNLAMAYQHVGRYEDAIVEGKKASQINPNDLSTPLGLVLGYAKLGRTEEARDAAAELLKIDPQFSLDRWSETMIKMFAPECQSEMYNNVELLRKADVGLE